MQSFKHIEKHKLSFKNLFEKITNRLAYKMTMLQNDRILPCYSFGVKLKLVYD